MAKSRHWPWHSWHTLGYNIEYKFHSLEEYYLMTFNLNVFNLAMLLKLINIFKNLPKFLKGLYPHLSLDLIVIYIEV